MAVGQTHPLIRELRRAALCQGPAGRSDGQLLQSFISHRDEAAFEALVRRHGPMVLGVCRRILRRCHDAEDAFQATFLVLARKAASVSPRQAVGSWLYGVARMTALRARAAQARRAARERQVSHMIETEAAPADAQEELLDLLDQELAGLPEKYRAAILLCDLEGQSRKAAAGQLAIPEGTLSSRLTTGRRLLARRLRRHGLALPGGVLAGALASQAALASVPPALVHATAQAALLAGAGQAAALGAASATSLILMEGVMKTMLLTKLKMVTVVLLAAGVVTLGGGLLARYTVAGQGAAGSESEKPGLAALPRAEKGSMRAEEPVLGRPGDETEEVRERPRLDPDVHEVNVRKMAIPFSLDGVRRGEVIRLHLFVSADRGKTWNKAASAVPEDRAFTFSAPRDGLYWLSVQTIGPNNEAKPSELTARQRPDLKIWVNTTEKRGDDGKKEPAAPPGDMVWERLGLKLEAVAPSALPEACRRLHLHGGMRIVAVRKQIPGPEGKPQPGPAAKEKLQTGDILLGLHHWQTLSQRDVYFILGYCQGARRKAVEYAVAREGNVLKGRLEIANGSNEPSAVPQK